MRLLVITLLFFFISNDITAQKQNNNWCFGEAAGVTFNGIPPTSFTPTISTNEGVSTISHNVTGALLFYASTADVYNRNYSIMPNGKGINTDKFSTCTQGVNIVPFVDDTNKYYVITLTAQGTNGRLSYSVVDRTLDGGLGDVVSGQKYIPIDSGFTEAMVIVEGCASYWLVVCKKGSADFYAYQITATGIDPTPVVSVATYVQTTGAISAMKVSPDGETLCLSSLNGNPTSFLALHDFDVASGGITNGRVIDASNNNSFYGCEFSPNSKRLYVTGEKTKSVYQYDLAQPTTAAITASKKTVHTTTYPMGGLQIGPDSNIYVAIGGVTRLASITNVDALYPNCVFTANAVTLNNTSFTKLGLPQAIVNPISTSANEIVTRTDTTVCLEQPLVLKGRAGHTTHLWQDGSSTDSLVVNNGGAYWVRSTKRCLNIIDTFIVKELKINVAIGEDTIICKDDTLTIISNAQPIGTAYLWSTGANSQSLRVAKSGSYTLAVSYLGCSDADTISVTTHSVSSIDLGDDAQLCKGDELQLPEIVTSEQSDVYLWQDGSTGSVVKVTEAGRYYVTLSNQCQTIKDTINITSRNCYFFFPSAFSPNGDGRNDIAKLIGDVAAVVDYKLSIFNRWGEVVYVTSNAIDGWDGKYKGQQAELGTYHYQIQYSYLGEKKLMKGDIILMR